MYGYFLLKTNSYKTIDLKVRYFYKMEQNSKNVIIPPVALPQEPGTSCSSLIPMRFNNNLQKVIYNDKVKNNDSSGLEIGNIESERWCKKCKLHNILKPAKKKGLLCSKCTQNKCVFPKCNQECLTDLFTCKIHSVTFLCKQLWQVDEKTTICCTANVYSGKYQLCGVCYGKFIEYEETLLIEMIERQRLEHATFLKKTISDSNKALEAFKIWDKEFTEKMNQSIDDTDEEE